ncbi:hypothetical protein BH20ACI4_BH20ACI4_19670 [soil metagenome]
MIKKRNIGFNGSVTFYILAVALVLGISLGYSHYSSLPANQAKSENVSNTNTQNTANTAANTENNNSFFSEFFGLDSEPSDSTNGVSIFEIFIRLLLSVFLAAVLAFRPRRDAPLFQRNLYVAQTQILLAVVAAALMLIVGDNAGRAFAIFAAVSLVRFRTNIKDPKEITVLLLSLALGLAAGVGKWELGLVLCLFALVLLTFLERSEIEQVYRSMELTIHSKNTDATQTLLKKIFNRYKLDGEIREITPPDETNPVGCITYYVNLRLNLSTDYLSDIILSFDQDNIEGIEWKQKKSSSYVYQ